MLFWDARKTDGWYLKESGTHVTIREDALLLVCVEAGEEMGKRAERTQERSPNNRKMNAASHSKATRAEALVLRVNVRGFPGGAVVESLPANAGDTGSSPGLGRSHMPRSN